MKGDIRVLVADDEAHGRDLVLNLLKGQDGFVVSGTAKTGRETIRKITQMKPDLVFLDIQMPDLTGFDVLRKLLGENLPYIIFVTAYDKFAIQAFEVGALDYLLKPVEKDRFADALVRAQTKIGEKSLQEMAQKMAWLANEFAHQPDLDKDDPYRRSITITERDEVFRVEMSSVYWFEAANQYVRLHCQRGRFLVSTESLTSLREQLDPNSFFSVHRAAIINIDFLKAVKKDSSGTYFLKMTDGSRVRVARSKKHLVPHLLARIPQK